VGASEEVQVHWLLERDAPSIEMVGSEPLAIRRAIGTTQELEGWISDGYGIKRAGLSVRATVRPARNALRVVSGFGALASREALQPILEESTIEEPDEASVTAGER
jgi:hypothetical protein